MEFKVGDKCKIIKRDPDNSTGFKEHDIKSCVIYDFNHQGDRKYTIHTEKDNVYVGLFNAHEIELVQDDVSTEIDLLEQTKLKYPVGTKYKCPGNVGSSPYIYEVKEGDMIKYWDSSNNSIDIIGKGYLYYCGKWAEIISASEVKQESKSLVGRYLKALVDEPQSTTYKTGDIVLLTKDYRDGTYSIEGKWTYTPNNKTSSHWMLMPEGFTLDSIKPQFEVGKWYKCKWNTHSDNPIYIKPTKITSDIVICKGKNSIWTIDNSLYEDGHYGILQLTIINDLTDLSEIQQYLPDGHSDKINKVVKYQPKFKIGDKVKAVDQSGGWGDVNKGDIGTVEKNDIAGRWKYSVDFPNHTNWLCNEKDLELYNESKMTVTFNPSQNAVPTKLTEYPVTPKESYKKEQSFDTPVLIKQFNTKRKLKVV